MSSNESWSPVHAKTQDHIVTDVAAMLHFTIDLGQVAIALLHDNACLQHDLKRATKAHMAARTEADQLGDHVRQLKAENARLRDSSSR